MRYLRIAALAAVAALAAIAVLRVTDVITAAQLPWLANHTLAAIALLLVAGLAIGAIAGKPRASDAADRPVP